MSSRFSSTRRWPESLASKRHHSAIPEPATGAPLTSKPLGSGTSSDTTVGERRSAASTPVRTRQTRPLPAGSPASRTSSAATAQPTTTTATAHTPRRRWSERRLEAPRSASRLEPGSSSRRPWTALVSAQGPRFWRLPSGWPTQTETHRPPMLHPSSTTRGAPRTRTTRGFGRSCSRGLGWVSPRSLPQATTVRWEAPPATLR